jgi:hypothetical protein
MGTNSEPGKTPEAEPSVRPGEDAAPRDSGPGSQAPGSTVKGTRPKSPREFIQERMRELDKKES